VSRFYFTYGLNVDSPFRGGWTVVEADSIDQAEALFRAVHPDRVRGVLNCACVYAQQRFEGTKMFKNNNNFGAGLQESIRLVVDRNLCE
jgi:hypothetical protein